MTLDAPELRPATDDAPGLRDRKKARRREEIVAAARALFARQGIDETTMNDIADACGISAPTVFNYFGSKDGILIAIIDEGTRLAREGERAAPRPAGTPLSDLLVALFSRIAARTLAIAAKRVWRHAEAAVIRHPGTEFSMTYQKVGDKLVESIADVLAEYDLTIRAGISLSPDNLAIALHDLWMPCFIRLITVEAMTLADHDAMVRERLLPLVSVLFDDSSLSAPRRLRPRDDG